MSAGDHACVEGSEGVLELETFYADLSDSHLHPLWQITRELLTSDPRPRAVPWLWPATVTHRLAEQALRLIPVDRGGDRRVLSLGNPGLDGLPYVAGTLWGAIQCLGGGETAPAHRHSPGAIRFVLDGKGVWTTVDGDACDMGPGDLVLTPSWNWHDHTSAGADSMFWFDGLDLPMVEALDAVFFEPFPDERQPVAGAHNASEHGPGAAGERFTPGSVDGSLDPRPSPLLVYRWADTNAALTKLASAAARDDALVSLEFTNPLSGASVLPTLSCGMHRLRAGCQTRPVRRTGNTVFVVYQGSGTSIVDGVQMSWSAGDMFVVPSWCIVEHTSDAGADLFSLGDAPVLRALGLYREASSVGPQQVTSTFSPATPSSAAWKGPR